jgi:hypothetical protein
MLTKSITAFSDVHVSDIIRAHEGNPDFDPNNPALIHWAKFSMIGRFVDVVLVAQEGCRTNGGYRFDLRPSVRQNIMYEPLMSPDVRLHNNSCPLEADNAQQFLPSRCNMPDVLQAPKGN